MTFLSISIDGASKGNPGAAGIGVVVCDRSGKVLREVSEYIGETTNNVAEYTALVRGLEEAVRLGADSVEIRTDSQLLAMQIAGTYRVKARHLWPLYERAQKLLAKFKAAEVSHVPREENAHADRLASRAAEMRPEENNASVVEDGSGQLSLM